MTTDDDLIFTGFPRDDPILTTYGLRIISLIFFLILTHSDPDLTPLIPHPVPGRYGARVSPWGGVPLRGSYPPTGSLPR